MPSGSARAWRSIWPVIGADVPRRRIRLPAGSTGPLAQQAGRAAATLARIQPRQQHLRHPGGSRFALRLRSSAGCSAEQRIERDLRLQLAERCAPAPSARRRVAPQWQRRDRRCAAGRQQGLMQQRQRRFRLAILPSTSIRASASWPSDGRVKAGRDRVGRRAVRVHLGPERHFDWPACRRRRVLPLQGSLPAAGGTRRSSCRICCIAGEGIAGCRIAAQRRWDWSPCRVSVVRRQRACRLDPGHAQPGAGEGGHEQQRPGIAGWRQAPCSDTVPATGAEIGRRGEDLGRRRRADWSAQGSGARRAAIRATLFDAQRQAHAGEAGRRTAQPAAATCRIAGPAATLRGCATAPRIGSPVAKRTGGIGAEGARYSLPLWTSTVTEPFARTDHC